MCVTTVHFVFQISSALTQGRHIRKLAIRVLRNMLVKHELDDRYAGEVMEQFSTVVKPLFIYFYISLIRLLLGSNKVVTLTSGRKQRNEPIRTRIKYM